MNALGEMLLEQLPDDVCEYVGIDRWHYKDFCLGCTDKLAEEWRMRNPKSVVEIESYYRENWQWYIGDLAWWHTAVGGRRGWFYHNTKIMQEWNIGTLLDFGGGIGTDSLIAAAHGIKVTMAEFDTPAMEFARWRAKRNGIDIAFAVLPGTMQEVVSKRYDCIFLIDVLEHIPGHHQLLKSLARRAPLLCVSAPFKDLSHPDADPYHPQHLFEEMDTTVEILMCGLGFHAFQGNFWIRERLWEKWAERQAKLGKRGG